MVPLDTRPPTSQQALLSLKNSGAAFWAALGPQATSRKAVDRWEGLVGPREPLSSSRKHLVRSPKVSGKSLTAECGLNAHQPPTLAHSPEEVETS